jgi:tetratricopeptide (TPR) repeat protein
MASTHLSVQPPPPRPGEVGDSVASPPAPASGRTAAAVLFVGLFALLLGSFPARNSDVWKHLAAGRELAHGAVAGLNPTWLYDLATFGIFQAVGGAGLVAAKSLAIAAMAVVMLRTSRAAGGWLLPVACTVLAVLAVGLRLPLQPVTVSYLLLALTLWQLWRPDRAGGRTASVWPGWPLVVLFLVWANVDRWFLLGLGTVALVWLGRGLDDRPPEGRGRFLLRAAGALAILAAVCAANPAHLRGFPLPAELTWTTPTDAVQAGRLPVTSPFQRAYFTAVSDSPAALAYYPLLAMGALSFLLARWRWERFLPWVALAILSGIQVRSVPFFAVVAGPVLAWNLQDYFARRPHPNWSQPALIAGRGMTGLLALAFLVAAWPGWLQAPPYGPRQWAVETPASLERGAAAVGRWHADGLAPAGTRTLHLSADTSHAFAWFCPEDDGLNDDRLTAAVAGEDEPEHQLREHRVSRLVVYAGDRGLPLAALGRMMSDPHRWPLLHLDGGVVIFGLRDPAQSGEADPFRGRELDLDRLAFRPDEDRKAPPARPDPDAAVRKWWEVFWRPAPPIPDERYEASVLLRKAELMKGMAPVRHLTAWEANHAAALAASAAAWLGLDGPVGVAVRLTLLHPPVPESTPDDAQMPAVTRETFALQQGFAFLYGDSPPGLLYAAVRAARRAVAANPGDANAQMVLAECYLELVRSTRERGWAMRFPDVQRLRGIQASAALNRAAALNPNLAEPHLHLGQFYQGVGCLDLALSHLRKYRDLSTRQGRRPDAAFDSELTRLADEVEKRTRKFVEESGRLRVADRATLAARFGLGGKARDILLESDVAAFGTQGMELQLDLLLLTGRVDDVINWTTSEHKGPLGPATYHWLRGLARAAVGDYAEADAELAEMSVGVVEPAEVAAGLANAIGQSLLDEQVAAPLLPRLFLQASAQMELQSAVQGMMQELATSADAEVIRGLVALEAGEIGQAREAFNSALVYAPARPGDAGLDFRGLWTARDCLSWIDAVPEPTEPAHRDVR